MFYQDERRQGRSSHRFYQDEKRDKGGHLTGGIRTREREGGGVLAQIVSGRERKTREVVSSEWKERQGRSYHRTYQGEIKQIQVGFLAKLV